MINSFNEFAAKENLFKERQKILLAISGGVDSVVLLHLFAQTKAKIAIAHCNFQLRAEESDLDEDFVLKLGKQYDVPVYTKTFDTIAFAKENKLSIEMAARDLRYHWFQVLLETKGYDLIATGHHINDSIETFFLNLSRGTGINGLTGIPAKNDNIIRPLLFANREQINKYAKTKQLHYRYDQSNDSTMYMRNIIRHQLIPIIKKINPSFEQVMETNLNNLKEAANLFNHSIKAYQKGFISTSGNQHFIHLKNLEEIENKPIILFETLKPFNFNAEQVSSILHSIATQPGKLFFSTTHQLLIDREAIIIEPIIIHKTEKWVFKDLSELMNSPVFASANIVDKAEFKLKKKKQYACLDLDKLVFPIKIRKWKPGDSFHPLGMKKSKKLSDFFIDIKLNRFDKTKVLVMISDKKIVWILNQRIDNRFKVGAKTDRVLILEV